MNFKYRRSIAAGLCLGGLLAATLPVAVGGPADVALFTSAEARQLMLDARQGLPIIQSRRLKQRSMVMGPRIEMKAPPLRQDAQEQTVLETGADAEWVVEFLKNQADVDMASLEVEASKGLFSVSLTERLRPFVHGNALEAKHVKVPTGQFQITIRIADTRGNSTEKTYLLSVRN